MKRVLLPILVLSLSIFACSIPGNSSTATDSPLPVSTTEISAPPTDIPVGVQANVICGQLSFYLDPSLARGGLTGLPRSCPSSSALASTTSLTRRGSRA